MFAKFDANKMHAILAQHVEVDDAKPLCFEPIGAS